MSYTVEHRREGLSDLLEEWVRDGCCGWLLIHRPDCDTYLTGATEDDCTCIQQWIGPFGKGFEA